MNALLAQAKAAAEAGKITDQTEDKGGFEYAPPEAGPCLARLVSYIETGDKPQEYNGQAKAPAPEVILEFQLYGKKHAYEYEVEEDGQKVTKIGYPVLRVGEGPTGKGGFSMPGGSKSNYFKLFTAMAAGRTEVYGMPLNHMSLMLGELFIVTVVHSDNGKEGKEKRIFANIRDKAGWKIGAPVDPVSGDAIQGPDATVELRMLMQDAPTIEQWESIFIDGTYKKKVGDTEVEVSKNWIQETCMKSLSFSGSSLEAVILEAGGGLPELSTADLPDAVGDQSTPEDEKAPDFFAHPSTPAIDDPLAAISDLGL